MTRLRSAPWILALAACAFMALAASCRKPPPHENMLTQKTPPSGGGSPVVDAGPIPKWDGGAEVDAGPFSEKALLTEFASCALGRYRAFLPLATQLRDAAAEWSAARSTENEQAAREAWRSAMAVWEEAELFQYGPAAVSSLPGGRDLRNQIYAWPVFSRCKVDEQLVARTYDGAAFSTSLINARGLGAVEYLIFYTGTDNACSEFSTINGSGTWAALSSGALIERKAAYAAAAAGDVLARTESLISAWEPAGGNFTAELVNAGAGSKTFAARLDALDAVSGALFYVDKVVKDAKLGKPLGYLECEQATCPDAVESLYARRSVEHLRANLIGFRRLFQGCGKDYAGLGFDDWLRAAGATGLADDMMGALVATQAAVDALDAPIDRELADDPTSVALVHARLKVLTDLLKTEFVTVLHLQLPKGSEGDND